VFISISAKSMYASANFSPEIQEMPFAYFNERSNVREEERGQIRTT
jgi:hypothetical protein